ncbi:hypothetical protein BD410DRAFT_788020 [Rickenella mellea]|uniref:Uncharacterized protein n=1 Tax=Rickenella mellea TaxID=50990 RepID=A0A4Y7Q687_9AGAM|nr:hypothetical protein BD410DRAFT_788020 [Rickenella mellea]
MSKLRIATPEYHPTSSPNQHIRYFSGRGGSVKFIANGYCSRLVGWALASQSTVESPTRRSVIKSQLISTLQHRRHVLTCRSLRSRSPASHKTHFQLPNSPSVTHDFSLMNTLVLNRRM